MSDGAMSTVLTHPNFLPTVLLFLKMSMSSNKPNPHHQTCPSHFLPKQCMLHISEPIDSMWDDTYVCDAPLQSLNCRLHDINQKSLVLSGPHELQALHLTRQNMNQEGKWEILILLLASWQLDLQQGRTLRQIINISGGKNML